MTGPRMLTGVAAIALLMVGTGDARAQQASASVTIVVAPVSRIGFAGMPGEGESAGSVAAATRRVRPVGGAHAGASAAGVNDRDASSVRVNGAVPTSSARRELRASASTSGALTVGEAMAGDRSLCATATDRRSARSTGPLPRLFVTYDVDTGDPAEPTPRLVCTLVAP